MATMISIALCWLRLPVANPSLALHHASEIAGAAHNGSTSDLAPCSTVRCCSSLAPSANRTKNSSLAFLASSMKLLARIAISACTSGGSCRTLSRWVRIVLS
jgi:hypothetical protein